MIQIHSIKSLKIEEVLENLEFITKQPFYCKTGVIPDKNTLYTYIVGNGYFRNTEIESATPPIEFSTTENGVNLINEMISIVSKRYSITEIHCLLAMGLIGIDDKLIYIVDELKKMQ